MSKGNISYHQHTPQWNKHIVKRILENGRYLGTDVYPRLVSDEDFLAVQLQREDRIDYRIKRGYQHFDDSDMYLGQEIC